MSKMHYFDNKFSKIAKRCGLSAFNTPYLSILVTYGCVIWPNCDFSNWLWRNQIL